MKKQIHQTLTPGSSSAPYAQFALTSLAVRNLRDAATRDDVPYTVRLAATNAADLLAEFAGVDPMKLSPVRQAQQAQQAQESDPAIDAWADDLDRWIESPDGQQWLAGEEARRAVGDWNGIGKS